jgi:hypothetical protein
VTLTVTDDDGATGSTSTTVPVAAPPPPPDPPADPVAFRAETRLHKYSATHTLTVPASVQEGDALLLFTTSTTAHRRSRTCRAGRISTTSSPGGCRPGLVPRGRTRRLRLAGDGDHGPGAQDGHDTARLPARSPATSRTALA